MKNHNEMYKSLLSRYNEYEEKKKKRIRTIRRTVPVLACFCFVVVFGLGYWDDLEKLPNVPISPNIVEDQTIDNTGTTSPTDVADTTENSQAAQGKQTDSVSTTIAPTQTETNETSATGSDQTVTTAVSDDTGERDNGQEIIDNGETDPPAVTTPVSGTDPVTPPQTTAPIITTQPITEIQTTVPPQTTAEIPQTTYTETEPNIPPTTTEPPDGGYYYNVIILDDYYYWNTYTTANASIDEELIQYYQNDSSGEGNGTGEPMPPSGTRYYKMSEYEVAFELYGKWMIFRRYDETTESTST